LRVGEQAHTVVLDNDQARVDGGEPAPFHLRRRGTAFELHWGERRLAGHLIESHHGDARHTAVFVHGQDYPVEIHPARESDRAGGQDGFIAPMSGTIVACHVAAGATVAAGDAVITLEAMKMEHTLRAGAAGTVERFHVADGDSVAEGTLLVDFNSLDSETEAQ
jgi:3-methylcrotonyl-CoA carboxylase alpha subunit